MFVVGLAFVLICSVAADQVCFPPCGCFSDDPPFDGARPLPESPEVQEASWRLYTRSNPNIGTNVPLDGSTPPDFVPSKETHFLIHGWISSPFHKYVTMNEIKDVILDSHDNNVIVVDWSTGASHPTYNPSASNTRVIGACSGQIARQMGAIMGNVYCVGHSLGGHACGYMGAYLGGQMGRITGLDPAGPLFNEDNDVLRLDSTDAQFVDIIITNAGDLGNGAETGHANFLPNNGLSQPGCATGTCDHNISTDYYMASVEFGGSCQFTARPCDSNVDANLGNCENCVPGVTCQRMGYYAATENGRGRFFLRTVSRYPHCED